MTGAERVDTTAQHPNPNAWIGCVVAEITVFYEGPIVTLQEAKARGLKRYFTGKPCRYGHIAERGTASRGCLACQREASLVYDRRRRSKRDRAHQLKIANIKYRAKNRLKERARSQKYREGRRSEESLRKDRERVREWRLAHPEEHRATVQRSRLKHAEKYKEYQRVYYARYRLTERGKVARKASNLKRRAAKASSVGELTAADLRKLYRVQKNCHICGKRFTKADPATIDHVVPLSGGGPHDISNISLAHKRCNSKKKDRSTHLI